MACGCGCVWQRVCECGSCKKAVGSQLQAAGDDAVTDPKGKQLQLPASRADFSSAPEL